MAQSQSVKQVRKKKRKVVYQLRRNIFRIFMFFSVIVMLVSALYTICGLLWVKLFQWTKDAVEASILLNVDILA